MAGLSTTRTNLNLSRTWPSNAILFLHPSSRNSIYLDTLLPSRSSRIQFIFRQQRIPENTCFARPDEKKEEWKQENAESRGMRRKKYAPYCVEFGSTRESFI